MAVQPINSKHSLVYAGVVMNVFHAEKGQGLPQHSHSYAHATMCHSGSILVRKDGKEMTMTKATAPINLIAGEWHEIEALEGGTVFVNLFADGKY